MVVRREYANPAGIIRHKGHQVKVALAIKIAETAVPGQKRIPALRRHTLIIIIGPMPPGINMAVILAEVLLPHDDDPIRAYSGRPAQQARFVRKRALSIRSRGEAFACAVKSSNSACVIFITLQSLYSYAITRQPPSRASRSFRVEDLFHPLPFLGRGGAGGAALKL